MHRNPVTRGLVQKPEDWAWSSFRHYASGVEGTIEIESHWTAMRRDNQAPEYLRYREKDGRSSKSPRCPNARHPGHPPRAGRCLL